ncbi:hypothetical protein [Gellertiella hungarica]|uniref:Uncharacterized protein n=1 Tax=Gellertiella hungarica TaxID=1572859 RepID=A0A7W6JAT1_9HYPH|nr:hypothetical protein [Gellertiella hungarica]MBB4067007.1 hypothetical protein [Gellertiella hungarica]
MSIVNVIVDVDHVTFVTDTRAVVAGGLKRFDVMKTAVFNHMALMLATRGKLSALEKYSRLIQEYSTDYLTAIDVVKARLTDADEEVFIGGIYGGRPRACRIAIVDGRAEVLELPGGCATPSVSEEDFASYAADPIAGMPALLAAQARRSSACGGWANVATMRNENGTVVTTNYTMARIPEVKRVLER